MEEFSEGKWNKIGAFGENFMVRVSDPPSKEQVVQNDFKALSLGRKYRLKITFPVELISKELEFKK